MIWPANATTWRLALVFALVLLPGCKTLAHTAPERLQWTAGPDLPRAITNHAVAATSVFGQPRVYAFLGLGKAKDSASILRDHWRLDPTTQHWTWGDPVPGARGRLAATAQAIDAKIYVVGGYTVDPDGTELSLPVVDIYDPERGRWDRASAMPTPVDDTVSAVWRDRYLVLVSGWHQTRNVHAVSLLDTKTNTWIDGTPIPGPAVFGHSGGIVGDTLVYCDGVEVQPHGPRFALVPDCYTGDLSRRHIGKIVWQRIAPHPGPPRYRSGAASLGNAPMVIFAGGSTTPYNYNGIGYDGIPAEPTDDVYGYDTKAGRWTRLAALLEPRMDLRGLAQTDDALWLTGGMGPGQTVQSSTFALSFER